MSCRSSAAPLRRCWCAAKGMAVAFATTHHASTSDKQMHHPCRRRPRHCRCQTTTYLVPFAFLVALPASRQVATCLPCSTITHIPCHARYIYLTRRAHPCTWFYLPVRPMDAASTSPNSPDRSLHLRTCTSALVFDLHPRYRIATLLPGAANSAWQMHGQTRMVLRCDCGEPCLRRHSNLSRRATACGSKRTPGVDVGASIRQL